MPRRAATVRFGVEAWTYQATQIRKPFRIQLTAMANRRPGSSGYVTSATLKAQAIAVTRHRQRSSYSHTAASGSFTEVLSESYQQGIKITVLLFCRYGAYSG